MALVAPLLAQVGLQVVLQPTVQSVVARAMCQVVGVAYPVYASVQTLEHPASPQRAERLAHWVRYWSVLACVSAAEAATSQRFPGYHHAKLLLLAWLLSSRYQGAARVYRLLLRPALAALQPSTEAFLEQASVLAAQPQAAAFAEGLHRMLASIPVVEWFVRTPPPEDADAASATARRRRNLLS